MSHTFLFDKLLTDLQDLKKVKLYQTSFKLIDDIENLARYYREEEEKQRLKSYIGQIKVTSEYIGTLKAILACDPPEDLTSMLKNIIKKLEKE